MVNEILKGEIEGGLHALSIQSKTPQQWEAEGGKVLASPPCMGGSKARRSKEHIFTAFLERIKAIIIQLQNKHPWHNSRKLTTMSCIFTMFLVLCIGWTVTALPAHAAVVSEAPGSSDIATQVLHSVYEASRRVGALTYGKSFKEKVEVFSTLSGTESLMGIIVSHYTNCLPLASAVTIGIQAFFTAITFPIVQAVYSRSFQSGSSPRRYSPHMWLIRSPHPDDPPNHGSSFGTAVLDQKDLQNLHGSLATGRLVVQRNLEGTETGGALFIFSFLLGPSSAMLIGALLNRAFRGAEMGRFFNLPLAVKEIVGGILLSTLLIGMLVSAGQVEFAIILCFIRDLVSFVPRYLTKLNVLIPVYILRYYLRLVQSAAARKANIKKQKT